MCPRPGLGNPSGADELRLGWPAPRPPIALGDHGGGFRRGEVFFGSGLALCREAQDPCSESIGQGGLPMMSTSARPLVAGREPPRPYPPIPEGLAGKRFTAASRCVAGR